MSVNVKPKWVYQSNNLLMMQALLTQNALYVCNPDKFIALNPESGRVIWEKPMPRFPYYQPILVDNVLFLSYDQYIAPNTTNYLEAIDAQTGQTRWKVNTLFVGQIVVASGLIVLANEAKDGLYIYDLTDGRQLIHYGLGNKGSVAIADIGDDLIIAVTGQSIMRLHLPDRSVIWTKPWPSDSLWYPWVSTDNKLAYLENREKELGSVTAYRLDDGNIVWTKQVQLMLYETCQDQENIYLATGSRGNSEGLILALQKKTGNEVWSKQVGYFASAISTSSGKLFAGTRITPNTIWSTRLLCLNSVSGATFWEYDIPPDALTHSVVANDRSVFFMVYENVHCFNVHHSWELKLGAACLIPATGDADRVYIATQAKKIIAATRSGGILWTFLADGVTAGGLTLTTAGLIFTSTIGTVYCLDKVTGQLRWSLALGVATFSRPRTNFGVVVFGCRDGAIRAVDINSGKILWSTIPSASWIDGGVATFGDIFIFGSNDGSLNAVNASGESGWLQAFQTTGEFASTPTIDINNEMVFAGNSDKFLYALDAHVGIKVWERRLDGNLSRSELTVRAHYIWLASAEATLYCISSDNGSVIWKAEQAAFGTGAPLLRDNEIISADKLGNITIYDAFSGKVLSLIATGIKFTNPLVIIDNIVYGCDDTQSLFALLV